MVCKDAKAKGAEYAAAAFNVVGNIAAFFSGKEAGQIVEVHDQPDQQPSADRNALMIYTATVSMLMLFTIAIIAGVKSFKDDVGFCNRYTGALLVALSGSGMAFGAGYTLNDGEANFVLLVVFSVFFLLGHVSAAATCAPMSDSRDGYARLVQQPVAGDPEAAVDESQEVPGDQGGSALSWFGRR